MLVWCNQLSNFRKNLEMVINRYSGEIRINPVPILRNDDFNNEGEIKDIQQVLQQTIEINQNISSRLSQLNSYLMEHDLIKGAEFNFAPGGYIAIKGLTDEQLLIMKAKGLIELFDFAADKDWVKRYGHHFGLIWENGRAIRNSE